jgi:hypothetical protein
MLTLPLARFWWATDPESSTTYQWTDKVGDLTCKIDSNYDQGSSQYFRASTYNRMILEVDHQGHLLVCFYSIVSTILIDESPMLWN